MSDTRSDPGIVAGPPLERGFLFPPPPRHKVKRRHPGFYTHWTGELALLGTPARRAAALLGLLAAFGVPFLVSAHLMRTLTLVGIASIGAIALSLLAGVAGQLSLGHAAFLGIGAYTAGYATVELGWPFLLTLPLAGVVAGLAGLILAPVALRIKGLGLAVVTLGFVFVMQHVFRFASSITGGVGGRRVLPPQLFGTDLTRADALAGVPIARGGLYWYVVIVALVLTILAVKNLLRSRIGRSFGAIRDHDIAAGAIGVPVFAAKTRVFVISSVITGIAGALLGGLLRVIHIGLWDLFLSIDYLAMVVIGGLGTVLGAVLGAAFIIALPEVLDRLGDVLPFISDDPTQGLTPTRLGRVIYGLALVLVIVAEPRGLVAVWLRVRTYVQTWPFKR